MNKDKWILAYIRQYRLLFSLSVLLGSATVLFGAALMFTSGHLISKAATRPESILMVYVPIVGVRTFGLLRAVFSYIDRLASHSLVLKILSNMRTKLYNLIEPQAYFLRSRFRTGDILGVLANDIEYLQNFYLKVFFPSFVSMTIYAVIIAGAGLFSIPFAILLAVGIGLLLFVGPVISLLLTKAKNEIIKNGRNQLYFRLTDAILGSSDWIFSGNYPAFIRIYETQERELYMQEAQKQRFINRRDFFNQFLMGLIVILVIAWTSGLTVKGELSPTLIAAFALAILSLLESFLPLSGAVSETTVYQDSVNRLNALECKQKVELHAEPHRESWKYPIEINQLSFCYEPGNQILDHITLKVRNGEKIAILGRSGSGKTTLLNLLMGVLSPSAGKVLINGCSISAANQSIANKISVLNQRAYLFNTSLMNNIRLGNQEANEEEVHHVCRMVQLDEMISQLPDGYETIMQETGQRFSGGERQRIALARVLLQNTPIVILDEPTVGLDPKTEVELLKTIFTALAGKTIIWVTHHLIGMEQMDRILFLEHGKITMEGTHDFLLKTEPGYRKLYQLDRPF